MSTFRSLARWLVRLEIVWLTLIYFYFVVSDQVPLLAFALIGLIWLARWRITGRLTRTTRFDLPILILLACLPISLAVTTEPAQSLPKIYGVLLSAAFFYAVVNAVQTRRDMQNAILWLVVVGAGIALAGLIGTDWAQNKIVSASFIYDHLPRFIQNIPRSIAGGFARNGVGGTLTLTIPLLAALALTLTNGERRMTNVLSSAVLRLSSLVWFALLLSLITLALTQSRGGILGTVVGLLALAIWRDRRWLWLVAVGIIGVIVLFAMGYGTAIIEFVLRMDAQSGTLASRLEVWQRGWMMVQDFPLTGIGIGTYNSMAHRLYPFFIASPDEVVAHAHNQFLQVAVDLGIPGLIGYLGLLVAFIVTSIRAYRASNDSIARVRIVGGVGCGILAHHVFGLTDAFMLGTKPGVVMWIYFAVGGGE
jgi:putative inorganic carbon (HCO3(-)) transporter